MTARALLPVSGDDPAAVKAALAPALHGEGPALLLLPGGPEGERLRAAAHLDVPVAPDVAVVVATSGSTGTPKFTELTAEALLYAARVSQEHLGGPGRWVLALPATRVGGLQVLVRSLVAGTDPVCLPHFTVADFAAVTRTVRSASRRYTSVVPTQLLRLLDAGVDLSGYDAVLVGGASIAPALQERARSAGVNIVRTYGMTETCGGCVYDGEPLPGVAVDIDVDGRIRIAGPMLARGYRNGPTSAFVNGWFHTDDLGRWRTDGRLEVLGRADEVIITGGVKVSPAPIEAALAGYPGVREVAVVGRPDPEWGQRVVAYVVPADPHTPPVLADLRVFVAATVDRAAAPRELVVVDALPLLPSGKVDRAALGRG